MTEPSEQGLLEAVKESLNRDGRLNKFKAELRAAVMATLNKSTVNAKPPDVPEETWLLNELIKEYLEWNGYRYSEQILIAESGQEERIKREVIAGKMGVLDDNRTSKIPLLYFVLADFQKKN